jgi:hypothetical protein
MQDFDHFKSILAKFAEEGPVRAFLYRQSEGDEEPEATGAFIVVGEAEGRRFTEVHGLRGEMPANIRVEDDAVLVGPPEDPSAWETFDDEDAGALRAFTLMDPRVLGELLEGAEFDSVSADETRVIGKYNLASLPGLPDEYIEYLGSDTLEREVEVRLVGERVVEISQPDVFPRQSDRIFARFES